MSKNKRKRQRRSARTRITNRARSTRPKSATTQSIGSSRTDNIPTDYAHITRDLRRTAIIASLLILALIGLSFVI